MTTYSSGSGAQASFQYKTKDMAIKYKGDANSRLAEIAGEIALLAAESQNQRNYQR